MRDFYCNVFGWHFLKDRDGLVLFRLNGMILALCPAETLSAETGAPYQTTSPKSAALAVNVASAAEVDRLFAWFVKNGVTILKAPEQAVWGGYRGYIADIEENCWEIVWNPHLKPD